MGKARRTPSAQQIARNLKRDFAQLIQYLNDQVVPEVRTHSTGALRQAAKEMTKLADYLEKSHRKR
ncbi:MAG TPA: hypothetical protein VLT85_13485 [Terriglobales bacterium]|nr:hypothetical protein [Terriglobales bacterium]